MLLSLLVLQLQVQLDGMSSIHVFAELVAIQGTSQQAAYLLFLSVSIMPPCYSQAVYFLIPKGEQTV
jgi:hypothetical protein